MITAKAFAGKHYAVLGLARSGLAAVNALLASGARVTAWDDRAEARAALLAPSPRRGEGRDEGVQRPSELANSEHPHHVAQQLRPPDEADRHILSLQGEGLIVEDFTATDLSHFDSIVVTPGLPLNRHPIAARAKEAGVEIIGDIELFARARPELPPHKVVGITGTNGKSTTTALVHHILKTAGVPTEMGGNIGLPILALEPLTPNEKGVGVYVLELSSYQIDLTKSLDCDVAVLLNITPDHLDRYESFEAYAASKARLFEMQSWENRDGRIVVVDDPEAEKIANSLHPVEEVGGGMLPGYDEAYLGRQKEWPALQGPHNAQNAIAAIFATRMVGIDWQLINRALRTYPGLPHRMERIRELGGVLFVNDSKATNAEAAAPALAAYPRIRWIVGGLAKAETLGDTAKHLDHVVRAYTIGEAGPMFARLLREQGVDVLQCETLENAVKRAAEDSHSGETVLLSPASASFDQFRDFEARGDAFRKAVGEL